MRKRAKEIRDQLLLAQCQFTQVRAWSYEVLTEGRGLCSTTQDPLSHGEGLETRLMMSKPSSWPALLDATVTLQRYDENVKSKRF